MGEIVQYLLTGLSLGGIYALVALGFYIMWEATKAANFTHGDVYMFGAVVTVVLVERGLPLLVAAPIAIAAAAIIGALIERLLVRPFNKEPNAIGWMLTTIAAGIMIESLATISYGPLGRPLPSPLAEQPIRFGGAGIYAQEMLLPIVAAAAMFVLEFFYRRARRHPHCTGRPGSAGHGGSDRPEGVRGRDRGRDCQCARGGHRRHLLRRDREAHRGLYQHWCAKRRGLHLDDPRPPAFPARHLRAA
jgi:hypothetical protein